MTEKDFCVKIVTTTGNTWVFANTKVNIAWAKRQFEQGLILSWEKSPK